MTTIRIIVSRIRWWIDFLSLNSDMTWAPKAAMPSFLSDWFTNHVKFWFHKSELSRKYPWTMYHYWIEALIWHCWGCHEYCVANSFLLIVLTFPSVCFEDKASFMLNVFHRARDALTFEKSLFSSVWSCWQGCGYNSDTCFFVPTG